MYYVKKIINKTLGWNHHFGEIMGSSESVSESSETVSESVCRIDKQLLRSYQMIKIGTVK